MLPASKGQLTRLGKRLVAGTPAPEDQKLYAAALDAYDRVQVALVAELRATDWGDGMPPLHIQGRTKTLDTLVQKLRRTPEVQLPYVRDIVGARIVGDMTLDQQTAVGERLIERYGGRLIDRRKEPQAGYRALHAAITLNGLPAEVQVRTKLQHLWAEIYERTADQWGREIRYGGPPDQPPSGHAVSLDMRIEIIATLQDMSHSLVDSIEVLANTGSSEALGGLVNRIENQLLEMMRIVESDSSDGPGTSTVKSP